MIETIVTDKTFCEECACETEVDKNGNCVECKKYIYIICLNNECNKTFRIKTNGVKYRHYEKDNTIRVFKKEQPLACTCGSSKLAFKIYHNVELEYPK